MLFEGKPYKTPRVSKNIVAGVAKRLRHEAAKPGRDYERKQ